MVELKITSHLTYHGFEPYIDTTRWFTALLNHIGELCSLLGHRVLLINGLAYVDEDIEERKNPLTYDSLMFVYPKCIYNWVWEDYMKMQNISRKEKMNG